MEKNTMKKTMKNTITQLLITGLILLSVPAFAVDQKQLKAFPQASEGMKRLVIELPHKERGEEDSFKVELIPGKTMQTDGVNKMHIGTTIIAKPLKGWGYTFYEVTGSDVAMSTMIAAPEGSRQVDRFAQGKPLLIQYNSRLPIVIYVPDGNEIQYRIWSGGVVQKAVNK